MISPRNRRDLAGGGPSAGWHRRLHPPGRGPILHAHHAAGDNRQDTPNGVPRRLRLPAGPVAAQFAIRAPAPPSHTFTVRILAPRQADVAVWLQTWYGQRLDVLTSTRDRAGCQAVAKQTVCLLRFPRLEAQR